MNELITTFPNQLLAAIEIGEKAKITFQDTNIQNVLITGVGGSGIGGGIVSKLIEHEIKIPVIVNKGYFLPSFVNENTLVIVSSYSGDTEETYNAFKLAKQKKAKIVCITSGGKILKDCIDENIPHIIVPGGNPPRACLGYSLVQQLYVFSILKLISNDFKRQLKKAIDLLVLEKNTIINEAESIAKKMAGKIPIIYSEDSIEPIAIRFRQQLNENSKILCWHHVIPEMNHNELVGWTKKSDEWAVIFINNDSDYKQNKARKIICENIINKFADTVINIYSKGDSFIEKNIYLIHFVDWISLKLSEFRNVDSIEIHAIDFLKSRMKELEIK